MGAGRRITIGSLVDRTQALSLEFLEAPRLFNLQAAVFLAPAIVRLLRNPQSPTDFGHHRLSKTQPKPQSQEPPPPIRAARPAVDPTQPSKRAPEPLGRGALCHGPWPMAPGPRRKVPGIVCAEDGPWAASVDDGGP